MSPRRSGHGAQLPHLLAPSPKARPAFAGAGPVAAVPSRGTYHRTTVSGRRNDCSGPIERRSRLATGGCAGGASTRRLIENAGESAMGQYNTGRSRADQIGRTHRFVSRSAAVPPTGAPHEITGCRASLRLALFATIAGCGLSGSSAGAVRAGRPGSRRRLAPGPSSVMRARGVVNPTLAHFVGRVDRPGRAGSCPRRRARARHARRARLLDAPDHPAHPGFTVAGGRLRLAAGARAGLGRRVHHLRRARRRDGAEHQHRLGHPRRDGRGRRAADVAGDARQGHQRRSGLHPVAGRAARPKRRLGREGGPRGRERHGAGGARPRRCRRRRRRT